MRAEFWQQGLHQMFYRLGLAARAEEFLRHRRPQFNSKAPVAFVRDDARNQFRLMPQGETKRPARHSHVTLVIERDHQLFSRFHIESDQEQVAGLQKLHQLSQLILVKCERYFRKG